MLTCSGLRDLYRALRDLPLLSVYVDGRAVDPAARAAWRTQLAAALADTRSSLAGAPHAEREAFERSVQRLHERLGTGTLGADGFVAFVAADSVRYAESLPAPVATTARWTVGPRIAQYIRMLELARPAIVVVADRRRALVFRFLGGRIELLETLRAHPHPGPAYHMGSPPSPGFHQSTRGRAAREQRERAAHAAFEAMRSALVERVGTLAGIDGWIVVAGDREAAREVVAALPPAVKTRAALLAGLGTRVTDAGVALAAEHGVARLRGARDLAVVDGVIASAADARRCVVGGDSTRGALAARAVGELLFTPALLASHPDDVELAARAALEQGAVVREVCGVAADRLDARGEGLGARLRFVSAAPAVELPAALVPARA